MTDLVWPKKPSLEEVAAGGAVRKAYLRRVIDGDTVVMDVDLGFRVYAAITVRARNVNAPERNTDEGKAAKSFTSLWFYPQKQPTEFLLRTYNDDMSFTRWVGDIWYAQGSDVSWSQALVEAGQAVPWSKH